MKTPKNPPKGDTLWNLNLNNRTLGRLKVHIYSLLLTITNQSFYNCFLLTQTKIKHSDLGGSRLFFLSNVISLFLGAWVRGSERFQNTSRRTLGKSILQVIILLELFFSFFAYRADSLLGISSRCACPKALPCALLVLSSRGTRSPCIFYPWRSSPSLLFWNSAIAPLDVLGNVYPP